MTILSLGAHFLEPLYAPDVTQLVSVNLQEPLRPQIAPHAAAAFAFGMNTVGTETLKALWAARDECKAFGIPTVFINIEDPNSFDVFAPQALGFDVIATSDAEMIRAYQAIFPGAKVLWLPLACQPALHTPRPLAADARDFVLIANWYTNEARRAAVRCVIDPLLAAGYSLSLYAYTSPVWPERYRRWWRGATSYCEVAQYYPQGRIALGLNNQAWGTAMCSMRTFEALACGKSLLSYHSDAYLRLGFVNAGPDLREDGHFVWVETADATLQAARQLLADPDRAAAMAARGREFVLATHTYAHRLQTLRNAVGR